ncbi:MAG: tRNA guanosine(34) transglycosylase Tgt [Bacteroidia bacterium]|jgi:queuine tRNA-ribosyltransferase|nr:tRNA guanosine(34) transglycosylase Tgt [Bacteroidia bacterium]MDG1746553.1 tRNA guanosine(34) transglycosylase Tgt [Bacteroidia bacterium]
MPFTFDLQKTDEKSNARAGVIQTDHGAIETPIFMPVGTAATVKGVPRNFLKEEINADIILGNTYHLYLRPGTDILKESGGIHGFSNWDRPILTDSGGYQVYSLANTRKIEEEGAMFKSHIDGSKHTFSPENVMDIQRVLGADIIMAFDECTPYPCEKDYARNSMHLTHRWLDRCMKRFHETEPLYGHHQELFPIVQGSVYPELRKESAEYVIKHEAGGYAIGGLSVGEPHEDMYAMTEEVNHILPVDKPRYLMGVGTPENILESIERGVDMFDCVMPTRNARNGMLFTSNGIVNIRNKKWERVFESIDSIITPDYSFAYMRHLFAAGEMLGPIIASIQNLSFYLWMVREARKHIVEGDFTEWKSRVLPVFSQRL